VALDHRRKEAEQALARALGREREAIRRHEAAARHLDDMAVQLEEHAGTIANPALRTAVLQNAARARERAESARERADHARERLRAET
jgi:hypothetical protein